MTEKTIGNNYFLETNYPISVNKIGPITKIHEDNILSEDKYPHDFLELLIVTEGTGVYCIDKTDFHVETGNVFLIPKGVQAYFKRKEGLIFYTVMYQPEKLSLPLNEFKKIPGYHAIFHLEPTYRKHHRIESHLHLTNISKTESIVKHMQSEIQNKTDGFEAALFSHLSQLIIYISRKYSEISQTPEGRSVLRVAETIGKLEQDYSKQWEISELASMARMSEGNFLRIFKETTGQSLNDYLIHTRIKKASEHLSDFSLSVTDIAYKVGIKDSNYFTRIFRKIIGVTPTKYRKQLTTPFIGK